MKMGPISKKLKDRATEYIYMKETDIIDLKSDKCYRCNTTKLEKQIVLISCTICKQQVCHDCSGYKTKLVKSKLVYDSSNSNDTNRKNGGYSCILCTESFEVDKI